LKEQRHPQINSMNLPLFDTIEYLCHADINLYSSKDCKGLASQVSAGRHIKIINTTIDQNVMRVRSVEDDYPGWLNIRDLIHLEPAQYIYEPMVITRSMIERRLRAIINFTEAARLVPNKYLWGGAVAPNYDCSGLMQAAFASQGIWLPRDSYQQEAFTKRIAINELAPGDLIFFGTPDKTDHVVLHLGKHLYIHSSGVEMGRNGIGLDTLSPNAADPISLAYWKKFRCCGRVMSSYQKLNCGR
jgi:NlpC/P60 family/Bacterial dipeptidyl-peptidase Sh3 domain